MKIVGADVVVKGAWATAMVARETSKVAGGVCRQDGRDDHQDRRGGQQDRRGYRPVPLSMARRRPGWSPWRCRRTRWCR